MNQKKTRISGSSILIIILFPFLTSCGDNTDFTGPAKNQAPQDAPLMPAAGEPSPGTPSFAPSLMEINWLWECQNPAEGRLEKTEDNVFTLNGHGSFKIPVNQDGDLNLKISGTFCPAMQMPRDIVFIIDASSSMMEHDSSNDGSCGRLDALNATMASFPDHGMQYAIVMFSDEVMFQSTKLFSNQQELFTDLVTTSGLGSIQNVICTSHSTTNYDAPLISAGNLLSLGRLDATKEIFFVSDGEPNDADGKETAKKLKTTGVHVGGQDMPVTIATIMLTDADDTILKDYIASRDQDDLPLHVRVDQANKLAEVLLELSKIQVVGGELRYIILEDRNHKHFDDENLANWKLFKLDRSSPDAKFDIPIQKIEAQELKNGLEINYRYFDRLKKTYESKGHVIFVH